MASRVTPPMEKTKTPGIYKRGNRYVVTYRDQNGRRRKRFTPTMAAAKVLKSQIATDIERGEYRDTHRTLFADYTRAWIDRYAGRTSKGIRDETIADYRARLEQDAIPLLGKVKLSDLTAVHLDLLASRVASGPLCRACRGVGFDENGGVCRKCNRQGRLEGKASSASTVRLALAPVKAMLADAVERGDLRINPALGYRHKTITRPATADGEEGETETVKALSPKQLVDLLDAIEAVDSRSRPFFEFLAQTGLRIGEAIEVQWGDVDFGKKTLRVSRRFYRGKVGPPKSKYGRRTVRLSDGMAQRLWLRWADEQPDKDALVWTAELGARVDPSNLMTRVLKPAAVAAGLGEWVKLKTPDGKPDGRRAESWVGFHTFRHTCATMLFRGEMNAVQVQRWLGHHKPSFTLDTYVHFLEDDLPETPFLDEIVGNTRATPAADNGRQSDSSDDAAEPGSVALRRAVSG